MTLEALEANVNNITDLGPTSLLKYKKSHSQSSFMVVFKSNSTGLVSVTDNDAQ